MIEPIIFFDTETGGLDPKVNPILTLGMITLDKDGVLKYPKYIKIIPPTDSVISEEALKKNGLNLADHVNDPEAVPASEVPAIFNREYDRIAELTGTKRPRLGGHNVRFDINMIKEQFFGGVWPRKMPLEGHCIDTMAIVACLMVKGIPGLTKHGLDDVLPLFGIETPQAHNAFHDAVSSAKLFKALMKI
jgi:DNA polymerase III epsilon subunit-like protein